VAAQENADAGSIRSAIRWGLMLAAVGTAGFRLPRLVNEFRAWREVLGSGDASVTEGWRTVFQVDLIATLVVLAIGLGVFYLLRPKGKAAK
jgi:hypothetical protein